MIPTYTVVTQASGRLETAHKPVVFSVVRPGETRVKDAPSARVVTAYFARRHPVRC